MSTRPAGLPHPWGATSCTRKAAGHLLILLSSPWGVSTQRTQGYMLFFAAMLQVDVASLGPRGMLGYAWTWLARHLNHLPVNRLNISTLECFLKVMSLPRATVRLGLGLGLRLTLGLGLGLRLG